MRACAVVIVLLLAACGEQSTPPRTGHYPTPQTQNLPAQALPGGDTTHISLKPGTALSAEAFSHPASNLPPSKRGLFVLGNSFFTSAWVSAPASVSARDGLGPLFMAASCQDCHVRDGRGHLPQRTGEPIRAAVLRIAQADGAPHPLYGRHLQLRALPGVLPEADVGVEWIDHLETLPDGTEVSMRRPSLQVGAWHYGAPGDIVISPRVAPSMIGLGLLEAIPQQALEQHAARNSGRLNRLADGGIGRFGWKATQPSVELQALDAFVNDIGITSARFPAETCTAAQAECIARPSGGQPGSEPELEPQIAEAVVFYARHLAVPARRDHDRPDVLAGEQLFHELGCASCHQPEWTTGEIADSPELSRQRIFAYTDLLLHDMGPGLADGVREFEAGGADWRTPPLWGLAQFKTVSGADAGYLHDGRARDLAEAILWHGGEAQTARDRWAALPKEQRRKLIRFLASL
ncbi:MAG: thiol oxidoreductase [Pseudomonadota bacterium]|nr:thiol oxidoreductase [Pseudomonadota bacterium]